uniref:C4L/C10L-like family protein n=2 Tax=unclassified Avipoxvirus TaxID=336487 RepID=A0AAT9UQ33_9POXV|nr:C4L/C10L-like gene family protein [Finch poxvirus]
MGITCFNNNRLSLHMFSDIYLTKIKETISNKSNFDVDKENTNKLVMIEDTLKENIRSLVYDELKSLIDNVKVCSVFTLITQEKECYLDVLLENQTYIDYKNKKTMCLLMFLKIHDNNKKVIRYVDKDKNPFMNITSDILFDKKLMHDLIIESGRKHMVVIDIDIDIKISPDTNLLATIEYLGSSINLYDKENDFKLCYCDIEIKKLFGYPYFLNVGLLFDRSGRCVKVHRDKKASKWNLFSSFEEFCINDVCEIEDIWIVDEDGKNSFQEITWSNLDTDNKDDDFLPIDSEFNKILCKLYCKNNIKNIKLRGLFNYSDEDDEDDNDDNDDNDDDEDDEDIYCFISRYYFDLPTKLELVDNIIRVLKEYEYLMPNWNAIPIELKREILDKMSYLELSELLIKPERLSENKVCNIRRHFSDLCKRYSYLHKCIVL